MSRPWMPLYIADYLADTLHFSAAEHGAYMLLIMHYWQNGGLPDDDVRLARIVRMSDSEWSQAKGVIRPKFGDGWRHERIEGELAEAERLAQAGRKGGEASAEARRKRQSRPKRTDLDGPELEPEAAPPVPEAEGQRSAKQTANDLPTIRQAPQPPPQIEENAETRARDPACSISDEAQKIADELCTIAGHDLAFVPPSWCGAAYRVQAWLNKGWPAAMIVLAAKDQRARKRDGPIRTVAYFEPGIAEAIARHQAPLPDVVPLRESHGTGGNVIAASDRLLRKIREFEEPAPGIRGEPGAAALRLLPQG